ncbi:MAG: DNA mismatch repair endonuclease MutL [Butyricicoccaceae bacterium]
MAVIHELQAHMADLIAAGEVVERPASVCKELVENAIDAGATAITVELEHGGITYLRITDNGCGMSAEDAPIAFRRHATSKIRTEQDLECIGTLGFRGEALAAISAVSRVDLMTKQTGALEGLHLHLEAGKITENAPAGCPEGTTFIIRDLFYNTPARMKFLKKDFTEANYVIAVVEHAAESHPEIAFRVIKDGKNVFRTSGGKLKNAVFHVFGRELAGNLIEVPALESEGYRVWGYISKPHAARKNRTYQHFFVNGRFIKSKLMQAALEEAYKNSIITGKYPYCCLCLTLPLTEVDVNVHPAKTEVKFAFEKRVFHAIYAACRVVLAQEDNIPELHGKQAAAPKHETVFEASQPAPAAPSTPARSPRTVSIPKPNELEPLPPLRGRVTAAPRSDVLTLRHPAPVYRIDEETPALRPLPRKNIRPFIDVDEEDEAVLEEQTLKPEAAPEQPERQNAPETFEDTPQEVIAFPEALSDAEPESEPEAPAPMVELPSVRVIGSCFDTYLIAEDADGLLLIDKHAAHERILFNRLRTQADIPTQVLLAPVVVDLSREELAAVTEGLDRIRALGFEMELFGDRSVIVREAPAYLDVGDLPATISEMAEKLANRRAPLPDRFDDLIHTVSCKAAIKAGSRISAMESQQLVEQVLSDPEVTCCPHGRPVTVRLTKYEIDKLFKRVNQ